MKFLIFISILTCKICFASNAAYINIDVLKTVDPTIMKYSSGGEKLFIGYLDAKISYATVFDLNKKEKINHCTSALEGNLAAISNDGNSIAIRVKGSKLINIHTTLLA